MLIDGELDAVLGEKSEHPDLRPLFVDATAEERSWFARHKVLPINHMVVVSRALADQHPDVVREVRRVADEGRLTARLPRRASASTKCAVHMALIIGYSAQQELISARLCGR